MLILAASRIKLWLPSEDRHADLEKQDKTLVAIKDMHADLGSKQDKTLDAIKDLGSKQDKTIEEIKGLREDVRPGLIVQIQNVQSDVRAIKDRLGMP